MFSFKKLFLCALILLSTTGLLNGKKLKCYKCKAKYIKAFTTIGNIHDLEEFKIKSCAAVENAMICMADAGNCGDQEFIDKLEKKFGEEMCDLGDVVPTTDLPPQETEATAEPESTSEPEPDPDNGVGRISFSFVLTGLSAFIYYL